VINVGKSDSELINISGMNDKELQNFMQHNAISLKAGEARKAAKLIGRNFN